MKICKKASSKKPLVFGKWVVFLSAVVAFSVFSCASVSYQEADSALEQGDFQTAYQKIAEQEKKGYKKKDLLLFYLDLGMLAHYEQNYALSAELLEKAEKLLAASITKSVSRELGSYIVNDTVKEYQGEDYENLYVNVFNALNYYHRGLADDALVEVRRLQNKLKLLARKYRDEFESNRRTITENQNLNAETLQKYLNSDYIQTTSFSSSALASYISMLFYRWQYRYDEMDISYRNLLLAFASQKHLYNFPVPQAVKEENRADPHKARLNCLAFYGLAPFKKAVELRLPLPPANWLKISLPIMRTRPSKVQQIKLLFYALPEAASQESSASDFVAEQNLQKQAKEKQTEQEETNNKAKNNSSDSSRLKEEKPKQQQQEIELQLLEDMEAVAIDTFKNHLAAIYVKTIIRALAKSITAAVLSEQAMEKSKQAQSQEEGSAAQKQSQEQSLAMGIVGIFSQLYAEFSEKADIRISRFFPAKVAVAAVSLPTGVYNVSVVYLDENKNILFQQNFDEIKLQKGKLHLLESFYLR